MEEGAQIDVGSEADRWWIIVGYSDGADVSGAVCGLGEGFMIWGFLSDVVVGGGVYNEKQGLNEWRGFMSLKFVRYYNGGLSV